MTFRRRMIFVTVVLGGSMWAFQPLMRQRIQSRLSEITGAQVAIGSSKISLNDGVIALDDIQIHPHNRSKAEVKIAHAALKFDWESVLYRNLTIENLIASEIQWGMAIPNPEQIPIVNELLTPAALFHETNLANAVAELVPILQPIKLKVKEEAAKQLGSHADISAQLKTLTDRIAEAIPNNNPLRSKFAVEEAKYKISRIRQSIAEDQISRREGEKAFASLKESSLKKLTANFAEATDTVTSNVRQNASELAKSAIAKQWNTHRPILHATLQSIESLEQENELAVSVRGASPTNDRAGKVVLPKRFTRLDSGKFRGVATLPKVNQDESAHCFDFEIKLSDLNTQATKDQHPKVALTLNGQQPAETNLQITCTAEQQVLPQIGANQIRLVLQRLEDGQTTSTIQVQHANSGWSSNLVIPMKTCLAYYPSKSVNSFTGLTETQLRSTIKAKLVGTSSPDSDSSLMVTIEPEGIAMLEQALLVVHQAELERERSELELRETELLNAELLNLGSRWGQLVDESSRTHSTWDANLKEIEVQIQQLEVLSKRTSRANTSTSR